MFKTLHTCYKRLFNYEYRYWLYKLRNPQSFKDLRTNVYKSPKGNFSLRAFDKNQAIFVHITKSAGTSIAKSLFGELPYHYSASQYRVIFGRKTFNNYYSFAFVRNPWDRLYSAYAYLKGGGWNDQDKLWAENNLADITDFNDFVCHWLTPERLNSHIHFWPQYRFICNAKRNPIINEIYYFESIDQSFKSICSRLNINSQLVATNASSRQSYTEIYNQASIEKVQSLYHDDITFLGYRFNEYTPMKIHKNRFTKA